MGFLPSICEILNIAIGAAITPARPMTPRYPASAGRDDKISFIFLAERLSHPTPDRGRAPTSGLMVEWSWRIELATGLALGSTPCSPFV